jgi:hypothetical protein
MHTGSIYKYLHEFRSLAESAMIEIAIAIENGRSLTLNQTRQVVAFDFASPPTRSTPNARPLGRYLTHIWVSRRV